MISDWILRILLVEEKNSKTFILMGWIIVPLNILLLKFFIMMFWFLQPAQWFWRLQYAWM